MTKIKVTTSSYYARRRATDDVFVRIFAHAPRKIKAAMYRVGFKVVSLLLVAGLFSFSIGHVGSTYSYFNDFELSAGNRLSATALDFTVGPDGFTSGFIGPEEGGGSSLFVPALSLLSGSTDVEYRIFAEKVGGSDDLCNAVEAVATTSPFLHSGSLLSLGVGPITEVGAWPMDLSFSLPAPNVAQGDVCEVDLVYRGWGTGGAEGNGYEDEERVHLSLRARMIVINEFLPNPEGVAYGFDFGADSDDKPKGEWVELFNNSDSDFDLDGWYVWDNSGSAGNKIFIDTTNTNLGTTVIPAGGFLVVYLQKQVLNNSSDDVRLYNAADELVDAYYYEGHEVCDHEPTPGDPNESATSGGVCDPVPPNKSYARIPDGTGGFVDPIPTPGFANTEDSEIAVASLLISGLEKVNEEVELIESENAYVALSSTTPEQIGDETNETGDELNEGSNNSEVVVPVQSEGGGGGGGNSSADSETLSVGEEENEETLPEEEDELVDPVPEISVPDIASTTESVIENSTTSTTDSVLDVADGADEENIATTTPEEVSVTVDDSPAPDEMIAEEGQQDGVSPENNGGSTEAAETIVDGTILARDEDVAEAVAGEVLTEVSTPTDGDSQDDVSPPPEISETERQLEPTPPADIPAPVSEESVALPVDDSPTGEESPSLEPTTATE
ncbi:MAG: hypothetical protein A3G59_00745 [Candidatus Taylorbacteria bacterium RIFCSPLOWO2_12_FULL_47_20]|uniref:LTD domain-containing protein n=2 Tax=Candidatus Tayloriibacteriota TaxID=1817919 RepID=A0A1G2P7T6_9BACT|nr:MAG: hypothetical protein A3H68_00495 [Candidatus Taylorbacteria bacterium RIFCSPLOWO2_02_FULL_46_40]OHA44333.1 MAG: hypothetical protein A3G59_00745 [Candidatus Taylorbacteria bacterium RIFCSPLOWO2_12_FULL_47_20]